MWSVNIIVLLIVATREGGGGIGWLAAGDRSTSSANILYYLTHFAFTGRY